LDNLPPFERRTLADVDLVTKFAALIHEVFGPVQIAREKA
jgi:hypothetical protein